MQSEKCIKSKIFSKKEIKKISADWKNQKNKIVFTNGCFDILHYGHVYYLAKAKEFGDKLIVGLNSDSSVKTIKGENRPINKQNERAFILASLVMIDAVVIFEEKTPENLINSIMPDILVKGGDYSLDNIVGAKAVINNGGKVEIIDFIEGFSTTDLLKKNRI